MVNLDLFYDKLSKISNIDDIKIEIVDKFYHLSLFFKDNSPFYKITVYKKNNVYELTFQMEDRCFYVDLTSLNDDIFWDLLQRYSNNDKIIDLFILKCYKMLKNLFKEGSGYNTIDYDYESGIFSFYRIVKVKKSFNLKE